VERWRNAPDPQGPSDSEPRNVATARSAGAPKKICFYLQKSVLDEDG
jgi:hypothetical protein